MNPFAEPRVIYTLVSLVWFSLTDLRYRTAPGIEYFFGGAVLLGLLENPLQVGMVVLAVIGVLRAWPLSRIMLLLFHPATWMVLWVGYCYRKKVVGGADWLALAGLACLFAWDVSVGTLISLVLWRKLWKRQWRGSVPVLPGMMIGFFVSLFLPR